MSRKHRSTDPNDQDQPDPDSDDNALPTADGDGGDGGNGVSADQSAPPSDDSVPPDPAASDTTSTPPDYDPPPAADPNAPPSQADLDTNTPALDPKEAEQLLRAGHRLRVKGDDPANWVSMTRQSGDMTIAFNATPDKLQQILSQPLILADS